MKVLSIVLSIVLLLVFSAPLMASTNDNLDYFFGYTPPDYREKYIECVDRTVRMFEECYQTEKELNAEIEKSNNMNRFLILLGAFAVRSLAVR